MEEQIRQITTSRGYSGKSRRADFYSSQLVGTTTSHYERIETIQACCDPKDGKFLEITINGKANMIVTGDPDLLILHPFREIAILTPDALLNELSSAI